MKGVIFCLLEDVVTAHRGAGTWDDLLRDAGLDGIYSALGSYPDEEFRGLLEAIERRLGVPADDALRRFGRAALPLLAARYPEFFAPHTSTRPFLLTLNDIIHPEVRKLYPKAVVPRFEFGTDDDGALRMTYRSDRRLCRLAEGFVLGAGDHYGERLEVDQPRCMHRGDPACLLRIARVP